MEELYEKICQLYYKLNDTFYCVNSLPNPFTPETVKLSNVSQFFSEKDEFILRFEHFDKTCFNLGIFFNGMAYKYIKLESSGYDMPFILDEQNFLYEKYRDKMRCIFDD